MFFADDFGNARFVSRSKKRRHGIDQKNQQINLPDFGNQRKKGEKTKPQNIGCNQNRFARNPVGDHPGGLRENQKRENSEEKRGADNGGRRFYARQLISKERESDGSHAAPQKRYDLRGK